MCRVCTPAHLSSDVAGHFLPLSKVSYNAPTTLQLEALRRCIGTKTTDYKGYGELRHLQILWLRQPVSSHAFPDRLQLNSVWFTSNSTAFGGCRRHHAPQPR